MPSPAVGSILGVQIQNSNGLHQLRLTGQRAEQNDCSQLDDIHSLCVEGRRDLTAAEGILYKLRSELNKRKITMRDCQNQDDDCIATSISAANPEDLEQRESDISEKLDYVSSLIKESVTRFGRVDTLKDQLCIYCKIGGNSTIS